MKTPDLELAKVATPAKDIVEFLFASSDFTTLSDALRASDLARTFKAAGPFTFFAPTDDAFAKLPAETLAALLDDEERLRAVLNHHVLRGRFRNVDLSHCGAKTLHGSTLRIGATDDGLTVDTANVTRINVVASNGMIHAVDRVLMEIGQAVARDPNEAESPWAGRKRMPRFAIR